MSKYGLPESDIQHWSYIGSVACQTVLSVAEDAPDYDAPEDEPAAPTSELGATEESVAGPSDAVLQRIAEGKHLRLSAAFIEGARLCASDQKADNASLDSLVARITGRTVLESGDKQGTLKDGLTGSVATPADLRTRLKRLARGSERNLSELLHILVEFDDAEMYKLDGCRNMPIWMDVYLGIGRIAAFERLRVGRALVDLPVLRSLFSLGQITFSQLREITRYASKDTDAEFAVAALELSVTETIEYCRRFRHRQDHKEDASLAESESPDAAEAHAAHRAFERRSLNTRKLDEHSTRITIDLPDDLAAEFLRSLEHAEDWIKEGGELGGDKSAAEVSVGHGEEAGEEASEQSGEQSGDPILEPSLVQRRADAAVLMSRRSLAHAGDAVALADRYRVHVNVDVRLLGDEPLADSGTGPKGEASLIERPQLHGHGPISRATARRLAEQSGFTLLATDDEHQVVGTSRQAPVFSKRQLSALRGRDRCCQMPGCGATRHLDGHHVVHRENGGRSGLGNAALLCSSCHRLLHEGGFRLQAVGPNGPVLDANTSNLLDQHHVGAETRNHARSKVGRIQKFRLFDSTGRELGSAGAARELFTRGNSAPKSSESCLHEETPR